MAYRTQAVDLSPEADRYQMALLRQRNFADNGNLKKLLDIVEMSSDYQGQRLALG
ncbi:hypothetical protein [Alkalinema sp. FACHB-956]|uniref:hypothetical protein n=1 Tax=Alkalinema sp. FACHB-956 TaxID=2692768 RepID=UPI001686A76A|nr:hypothetical protein [Alkalinema sp. FACHB-956]MBD2328561.1 hypothetical protein [Alkalinema sp. FACHB-956]